jgi:small-conductance mechanosensitive channel/CRP-like cAMP-binding protein
MDVPHWLTSPLILAAIVSGIGMQILIARRLREGPHVMRTHGALAAVGLAVTLIEHWLPALDSTVGGEVLSELVIVGWGLLFIRISCITLFRIWLPAIGAPQPRILHELIFILVCLGWGLVRLRSAGLNLGSIVTTSAAITAIVAFSMQETLGNILGGLALQLDKSFQIGDWIVVDNERGKVIEVRWRHTAVLTPAGEVVVLPNSLVMKAKVRVLSSARHPVARRSVRFATADDMPPQEVIGAVEKALRDASLAHVAAMPQPDCVVAAFEGGNTVFEVRYWLLDQQHDGSADSTVRLHIHSALRRIEVALARPRMAVRMEGQDGAEDTVHEQEMEKRVHVLSRVPLFASLEIEELNTVAAALRVTPFMKDDVMTRQGAVAHWLYVLVSGEADVWFEGRGGERRFVATLGPGAVFGEMGMMTGAARTATVTARTDAQCYRIDKESFQGILLARPELAGDLAQIVVGRSVSLDAVRAEGAAAAGEEAEDAKLLGKIRRFFHLPTLN